MLATLVDPTAWLGRAHPGWVFERKLDGLRGVAVRDGAKVELWSRNHNSFSERFPEVVEELARLSRDRWVLDGELVAHDGRDYVGFGRLQQPGSTLRVLYGVFDVLHADTRSVMTRPMSERKALLRQLVPDGSHVRVVDELPGDPGTLLDRACRDGWEGLIAKQADAPYVSGRSSAWLKLKCSASQELVIGGWTEPKGTRLHLGALLVGYYEDGRLRYAGKVGTGFKGETLADLARRLAPLERGDAPFTEPVRERTAHWVEPRLVANVAFTEWTHDGRLRHPRFEGLRPDKEARSVVRERPGASGTR